MSDLDKDIILFSCLCLWAGAVGIQWSALKQQNLNEEIDWIKEIRNVVGEKYSFSEVLTSLKQ